MKVGFVPFWPGMTPEEMAYVAEQQAKIIEEQEAAAAEQTSPPPPPTQGATVATYDLRVYIDPAGYNGSISLSPMGQYVSPGVVRYNAGTVVTCTAMDYEGGGLNGFYWSGDFTGFEQVNPTTVYMNGNRTLTAHFYVGQTLRTLSTSVSGQGTIFPNAGSYPDGDVITLTATPQVGWEFKSWGGAIDGCTQNGNKLSVPMTKDRYITATFQQESVVSRYLQLIVEPYGFGSINRSPAGTPVGSDVYKYADGTNVTLTAIANAGYEFDHWEVNGIPYSGNPMTLSMTSDRVVEAVFEVSSVSQYTLQVFAEPGEVDVEAHVYRHPEGTRVSKGVYMYDAGITVNVIAVPDDDWEFLNWKYDLSGTVAAQSFVMNGNKMIAAVFEAVEVPVEDDWIMVGQQSISLGRSGVGWEMVDSTDLSVGRGTVGWQLVDETSLAIPRVSGWFEMVSEVLAVVRTGGTGEEPEEPPEEGKSNAGILLAVGGAAALALMLSQKGKKRPVSAPENKVTT